jgi:large subunit ribosomal protein L30
MADVQRQISIVQVHSAIGRKADQKATLKALGIRRLHRPVVHQDTPQIRGMVFKVAHLVKVEKVQG